MGKLLKYRKRIRFGYSVYGCRLARQGISFSYSGKYPCGLIWFVNFIWGERKLWIGYF